MGKILTFFCIVYTRALCTNKQYCESNTIENYLMKNFFAWFSKVFLEFFDTKFHAFKQK